jgi:hypothetical protein
MTTNLSLRDTAPNAGKWTLIYLGAGGASAQCIWSRGATAHEAALDADRAHDWLAGEYALVAAIPGHHDALLMDDAKHMSERAVL